MNLEPLAKQLEDAAGLNLIQGKSIFIGEMPATCTQGVLLMGPYHGAPIDYELTDYIVTDFRVVVRDTDHGRGKKLANDIRKALTFTGETTLAGVMLVKQMLPINLPRAYRRSVGAYWEFEVDVAVTYVDLAP